MDLAVVTEQVTRGTYVIDVGCEDPPSGRFLTEHPPG